MEHPSFLSVVIATRDRGDRIVAGLRSILASGYPAFEVVVVDQSRGDGTEQSVKRFADDGRVRYLRSASTGVSAARNIGIGQARGSLVVVTDDDCEAPSNWLREFAAAFALDERVGVVAGNVIAAPHDRTAGFIPAYVRREPFLARGIRDKHRVGGISACMGIRRSVWQSLGGFDAMLGAGAPLKSGAEGDFVIRALRAGHWVYETPRIVITHHGFRSWEEGRAVIERYWFGTGATMIKNLRCGCWSMIPLLARQAGQWAFGRSPVAASLGARPHRLLRLSSFLRGCAVGANASIDRSTGHFAAAAPAAPRP
jgi:glycosyltransferase involved in cell wall biosynthesis